MKNLNAQNLQRTLSGITLLAFLSVLSGCGSAATPQGTTTTAAAATPITSSSLNNLPDGTYEARGIIVTVADATTTLQTGCNTSGVIPEAIPVSSDGTFTASGSMISSTPNNFCSVNGNTGVETCGGSTSTPAVFSGQLVQSTDGTVTTLNLTITASDSSTPVSYQVALGAQTSGGFICPL